MTTLNVLWFTLSPCGSIRRNNEVRVIQGWMISLEDEIKKCPNINLSVAYISKTKGKPFKYDGVTYYPICRNIPKNKIKRVLYRGKSYKKQDSIILPKLLNVVDIVKPDLIHIHGTEECFGLIQDTVKNIPIVFSIQGLIAPYTEKYFSGISYSDAKKHESFIDKVKQVSVINDYKSFLYRSVRENNYLLKADFIFGRTFWDRDCTLALNPKRKYYVVNEILREEFYTKKWKGFISDNKLKIVSTISGGIYKGFETILKTTTILKQYSHLDFEWHIAGYTSKTKLVHISEKITNTKSEDNNILFHGKIDADELSDLLCNSDIYVHVSHIENSPNSVCEAMMLGMPVIASYSGGTSSLLEHEKDGILYQDGDPYVLAGAIVELFQNKNKAMEYGSSARKKALCRHDKNRIINELITGYNSIILSQNNTTTAIVCNKNIKRNNKHS